MACALELESLTTCVMCLCALRVVCAAQILITKMVVEHWGGSFFYPNVGFILARLPLFWVSYYFWRLGV